MTRQSAIAHRRNRTGRIRQRLRGFTLIELMIVASIIPITTVAAFGLMHGLENSRVRLDARMDAAQSATRALLHWRTDVEMALRVELAPDGGSMTLWRDAGPTGAGSDIEIRYALSEEGNLERTAQAQRVEVLILSRNSSDLEFRAVGSGYALRWKVRFDDGIQRWEWIKSGFATPLAPQTASNAEVAR